MGNLEIYKQIFRDIRTHKLRSFLAAFGMMWGTAAVILLLALGEGFYQAGEKNMQVFSPGAFFVYSGSTTISYQGLPSHRLIHMKAEDVIHFKKALPFIHWISPVLSSTQILHYQQKTTTAQVEAVDSRYQILANISLRAGGRFVTPLDITRKHAVVILGSDISNKLFGKENNNPLEKKIYLDQMPFNVIGVLNENKSNPWRNSLIIIPYSTAIQLWGNKDISHFLVQPYDFNSLTTSQIFLATLTTYLSHYYHFSPQDSTALRVIDFSKEKAFFTNFFRSIELFLGLCGVLTLGIGAIGIANVMFLIISERQAEIGLRMAIGARYKDIFGQFMLETAVMVSLGAFAGWVLSWGSLLLLKQFALPEWLGIPHLSGKIVGITLIVLGFTGSIAGFFPAHRAASLPPIKALAF